MLKENVIRNFDSGIVEYSEFIDQIKKSTQKGYDVFIGTDSQVIKMKLSIVTCVCLYKIGTGKSQIFYVKNCMKKILKSVLLFHIIILLKY